MMPIFHQYLKRSFHMSIVFIPLFMSIKIEPANMIKEASSTAHRIGLKVL
jgi:hypothetical protein